ncbi:MAG: hypothetical protein Q4F72_07100, partial [Desulfovibrionaceae bacterium]|nr:hypothetical protein [Desulfovibrionaceae bacterium]
KGLAEISQTLDNNSTSQINISDPTETEVAEEEQQSDVIISTKARIRREGGGRKQFSKNHPEVIEAIKSLVEPQTYGDPMRVIHWTSLSLRKIAELLEGQGFKVSHPVVGKLLEEIGYSKQTN